MKKGILVIIGCVVLVLLGVINYNITKEAVETCVNNGGEYSYCLNGLK